MLPDFDPGLAEMLLKQCLSVSEVSFSETLVVLDVSIRIFLR